MPCRDPNTTGELSRRQNGAVNNEAYPEWLIRVGYPDFEAVDVASSTGIDKCRFLIPLNLSRETFRSDSWNLEPDGPVKRTRFVFNTSLGS
jgi:hypothetical protein